MKETMTGNRAIFKIAGKVIGVAQNVEVSDDFGLQEVDGLGNLEVQEYVPGKLTHRISGSSYFVVNQNLRQLNLVPESGDWLSSPEFEVEIQDALTNSTVESYVGCKFASHSRTYAKHQITGQSFQIYARHKAV
jgi:hypothetical protein